MRTAERSGYLASSSLICSTYGSSRLARGVAVWAGGCCSRRAAATVCREQCSRWAMARPESLLDLARRRISAHKATFMACSSWVRQRERLPAWRNSIAELHQPLARLGAAADTGRRQRQHLDQRQLVGDQVAVEQFLPGLLQSLRRQPQPAGQRVVAVERQAVAVGHGGEEQVQQHGVTRQIVAMLAQETAIHPGPAGRGRTPQTLGNQNVFLGHAWDSWGANGIEPLCPKLGR